LEACALLSARNVSFGYRRSPQRAVGGVSLDVAPGAFLGILGPNGSGKTTLLKLLGGLLTPSTGEIVLESRPLTAWTRRELARRIAIVPQELHPAFDYTVLEMALMGRFPHLGAFAVESPADISIARAALVATGVAAFESRQFSTLSGGEKQRVILAAALAQQADILLLDEPTASLDPGHQMDIAALLVELNRTRQLTLVVATHDLNLAASMCAELAMMRGGAVIASGPTREVLTALNLERLYDLQADVRHHDLAGHLTVVPIARRRS
jgi:iron complex transport system ATP-binding protein